MAEVNFFAFHFITQSPFLQKYIENILHAPAKFTMEMTCELRNYKVWTWIFKFVTESFNRKFKDASFGFNEVDFFDVQSRSGSKISPLKSHLKKYEGRPQSHQKFMLHFRDA